MDTFDPFTLLNTVGLVHRHCNGQQVWSRWCHYKPPNSLLLFYTIWFPGCGHFATATRNSLITMSVAVMVLLVALRVIFMMPEST